MATVKGLLEELQALPPDTRIHLAADAGGNNVHELDEISEDDPTTPLSTAMRKRGNPAKSAPDHQNRAPLCRAAKLPVAAPGM